MKTALEAHWSIHTNLMLCSFFPRPLLHLNRRWVSSTSRGAWAIVWPLRTATQVPNRGVWRHSAAFGELRLLFLNGRHRSVNRKVRSSNLRPGASFRCAVRLTRPKRPSADASHTFG
jgi:hypothetical protein